MVDRTAQAFRLKDEPSLGELESGLTSGYRDYTPEDKQTEEAFAEPELDVFSLPMGADPAKDVFVGEDELGNKVYKSPLGVRYTIKTVQPPERFTTEPATMARVGEVAQQYATGAIEGLTGAITAPGRALAGEPVTTGEVLDTAGLAATGAIPSIARGAIEGVDRDVLYSTPAGQAGGKPKRPLVPRFEQQFLPDFTDKVATLKTKFSNEIEQARERGSEASVRMLNRELSVLNLDNNDLFNDIIKIYDAEDPRYASKQVLSKYDDIIPQDVTPYNLEVLSGSLRYLTDYESSAILGSSETRFRSPIESVVQQLEYPRDGIKGAQFLKELKDNPDVRDSEVAGIGLDIDPQKRYTQQELMNAVSGRLYDVTVDKRTDYSDYQLQSSVGFADPQKDYFELVINAEPRGDNPGFRPLVKHYYKETLIHTRATISKDRAGDYIFVHELQSDLLQKGFDDSPRVPSPDDVYSQFQIMPSESTIQGVFKASPEEIQKGMSMALLNERLDKYALLHENAEKFTDEELNNAVSTLNDFTKKSTKGERHSYWLFRHIIKDNYPYNVPVEDVKKAFDDIKDYITKNAVKINPPPIAKTEEAVRLAVDALMAEGQKRGVSRIVIPPLEKIVEARASDLAYLYEQKLNRKVSKKEAMKMAMESTSGFYDTYVRSVNRVLDKYKKEFGDDFVVRKVELPYKSATPETQFLEYAYNNGIIGGYDDYTSVSDIFENVANRHYSRQAGFTFKDDFKYDAYIQHLEDTLPNFKYDKNWTADEFVINANQGYIELLKQMPKAPAGTEIDFSGLINKNYNLTRPRFAQGGMVDYNTETQMNRLMQEGGIADDGMRRDPVSGNEIPPGSMASEVRDDIPAQLSEGEYVVPADVLRYYGVAFFEQLRAKAKRGLAEMEAGGRIGGEPVEMEEEDEDEDELPFDISELETAGDDTDMQMAEMGMAAGGVVKMQEGGVPKSTFSPAQFQTPGSTYFATPTTPPTQQSEYRVYQNAQGQTLSILFVNGVPQQAIPEGYFPQGQAPAVTTPQPQDSSDREDREPQQPAKSFSEYTAQDWMNYRPDTGVGSTIGKIAGGVIGGALLGPAGAMIGGKLAEEGMARNSVSAYNALNDYVATLSRNDPSYAELAEKRNKMYGDLSAAQQENPGFFGNIFNNIFGKPEIAAPKTGTGGARPVATAAPAAAPAATSGRTEPSTQVSSGRGTGAASAPVGGRGTGATAQPSTTKPTATVRGVTAVEGPESTTPRKEYTTTSTGGTGGSRGFGRGNKGGLVGSAKSGLMQKPQSKKAAQKRKIKTTDA